VTYRSVGQRASARPLDRAILRPDAPAGRGPERAHHRKIPLACHLWVTPSPRARSYRTQKATNIRQHGQEPLPSAHPGRPAAHLHTAGSGARMWRRLLDRADLGAGELGVDEELERVELLVGLHEAVQRGAAQRGEGGTGGVA